MNQMIRFPNPMKDSPLLRDIRALRRLDRFEYAAYGIVGTAAISGLATFFFSSATAGGPLPELAVAIGRLLRVV
jgi:hypothetical protein